MCDSAHSPVSFRIVPDPSPKRVGLFQLESRRGKNWTLVSWGLTGDEADKQAGYAVKAGYSVQDTRHSTMALTKAQRVVVKSLIEDSGYTRKDAAQIVLAGGLE